MEHDDSSAPTEEHVVDPEVQPEADDGARFEQDDEMSESAGLKAKLQKLRDELDTAKKERQEYLDGWQRCKADAVNAKKDAAREGERTHRRATESLLEEIIPVLDSFEMAAGSESWLLVDEKWRSGMERVRDQLLEVLVRQGVVRYGAVGDMYDPHLHEAVQEIADGAGESGSIARILRSGYKSVERVVRPAQVIVKV